MRASQIFIQYKNPVILSDGSVGIFVYSNPLSKDPKYLRQIFSGQSGYCTLSENHKTIIIEVFTSTFNQHLTDYFVMIDDNFVKINETGEAVKGIQTNIWTFKTGKLKGFSIYENSFLLNCSFFIKNKSFQGCLSVSNIIK